MDVPRAVVLGAPPAATAVSAFALLTGRAPVESLFAAGLLLALPLGAYAVLRLRGDLALPLAVEAAVAGLVFWGMPARCAAKDCVVLRPLFDAFHVAAFAGALAAGTVLVASAFAPALRTRAPRAAAAGALAAVAYACLALGWALR